MSLIERVSLRREGGLYEEFHCNSLQLAYYMCGSTFPAGVVGRGVTVTDRCVIGAGCEVLSTETLSPDTIVYGADCRRYHKKAPLQVIIMICHSS